MTSGERYNYVGRQQRERQRVDQVAMACAFGPAAVYDDDVSSSTPNVSSWPVETCYTNQYSGHAHPWAVTAAARGLSIVGGGRPESQWDVNIGHAGASSEETASSARIPIGVSLRGGARGAGESGEEDLRSFSDESFFSTFPF